MTDIRIGFIGCGGNARGHMNRLLKVSGARIVAVCDISQEAAQRAAELTGGKPYANYEQMLDSESLDAVYLSLPVFAHGKPELAVIERGLPFFVEKPVALNLETAAEIGARVAQSGVLTCVGYQLRYLSHARAVKAWLADKEISLLEGHYWCGSGLGTGWQTQMARSGGQLVEQVTHTLDMFRNFAGEVDEVFSYQANRVAKHIDCPDVYAVSLRFANGAIGSLSSVWHSDPKDWSETNIVHVFYANQRIKWSAGNAVMSPGDPAFEANPAPGPNIDEVFVNAVRTGDRSLILTPYHDAIKSLAVSLAANESARTGQPVKVSQLLKRAGLAA